MTRSTIPTLDFSTVRDGVIPRLRSVVLGQPEAPAVVDDEGVVSYWQLAARAAGVRRAVIAAIAALDDEPIGRTSHGPVAMLVGHHSGAVATVLGVLASGRPLVVLDERSPVPRLRSLIAQVGACLIVCEPQTAKAAAALGPAVLNIGSRDDPLLANADELWVTPPEPSRAAVLTFTSGSTGRPKVVATDHRQLVQDAWVNSTATACYGVGDVMAHTLPIGFTAGLLVTVAGPLVGVTMAMYDVRGQGVGGLPEWLACERISVLHASPAILRAILDTDPDPALLQSLTSLTLSGEIVHGRDVERARAVMPNCSVRNRYGASETNSICEFIVRPTDPVPDGALPAGWPVGRTTIQLVDDEGRPVPDGASGTVVVTREQMAIGYWSDEATTLACFSQLPDGRRQFRSSDVGWIDDQGLLRLVGRRDHSVKIRGTLVEPGEVDAALARLPDVREAVVVGLPRPDDGRIRLVGYVVVAARSRLTASQLRAQLREALPGYMVPEVVVFLQALPRTERGKIDRGRLPAPTTRQTGSAGQDLMAWESMVADVWKTALSLDDIGLDDDFFELGGDSLAAEALVGMLQRQLDLSPEELTTRTLVEAPTVRRFAPRLTRTPTAGSDVLIPLRTCGVEPPLFIVTGGGGLGVAFAQLARGLGADRPVWALQAHAIERRGWPDWSVAATARRYLKEIRKVQPRGPYHLAGHSFGGLVALEMAHQLNAKDDDVAMLVLLDSYPPDSKLRLDVMPESVLDKSRAVARLLSGVFGRDDRYHSFNRLSALMHARYRPRPYAGDALVVLAHSAQSREHHQWARYLSGDWRTVEVSGDHLSILREPHVTQTSDVLAQALRAVPRCPITPVTPMTEPTTG